MRVGASQCSASALPSPVGLISLSFCDVGFKFSCVLGSAVWQLMSS